MEKAGRKADEISLNYFFSASCTINPNTFKSNCLERAQSSAHVSPESISALIPISVPLLLHTGSQYGYKKGGLLSLLGVAHSPIRQTTKVHIPKKV